MARLLLRRDGVLADQWCPLDPPEPYQPPDRWDAPHVQYRFAEALGVVARLPGRVWPRSYANSWPKDYRCEWFDMLAMLSDGGEAYTEWTREQNRNARSRPTSIEIQYCEAALCWPGQYLSISLIGGRALNVVGWCSRWLTHAAASGIWKRRGRPLTIAAGRRIGWMAASPG